MLTPTEMQQVADDVILGKPIRVKGEEAEAFAKEIEADVKTAKSKGLVIDIPREFEIETDW